MCELFSTQLNYTEVHLEHDWRSLVGSEFLDEEPQTMNGRETFIAFSESVVGRPQVPIRRLGYWLTVQVESFTQCTAWGDSTKTVEL